MCSSARASYLIRAGKTCCHLKPWDAFHYWCLPGQASVLIYSSYVQLSIWINDLYDMLVCNSSFPAEVKLFWLIYIEGGTWAISRDLNHYFNNWMFIYVYLRCLFPHLYGKCRLWLGYMMVTHSGTCLTTRGMQSTAAVDTVLYVLVMTVYWLGLSSNTNFCWLIVLWF